MKVIFVLISVIAVSASAFARDSSHLVCSGYMDYTSGSDNYGISIRFDEYRADDGVNRLEVLTTEWDGETFQGSRLNTDDGFGENGQIDLLKKGDPSQMFYSGSYNLVQDSATGDYSLELRGEMTLSPDVFSITARMISTSLSCVDISN